MLLLRATTPMAPAHIIQPTPCRSGVENLAPNNNEDDGFNLSCRKLHIFVQDQVSVNSFQSIYKENKRFDVKFFYF